MQIYKKYIQAKYNLDSVIHLENCDELYFEKLDG